MTREDVVKKKREYQDRIEDLKTQLTEDLRSSCVESGGHYFWGWKTSMEQRLYGWKPVTSRFCPVCGYTEYKEENENEV